MVETLAESVPTAPENDRAYWEVRKLQAEVESLQRPPSRFADRSVAILTALAAAIGILVQYGNSRAEFAKAEIDAKRAMLMREATEFENARLEVKRSELQQQISEAQTALTTLSDERKQLEAQLASAQSALTTVQQQLAAAPGGGGTQNPEAIKAVETAQASINTASVANRRAATLSASTYDRLTALKRDVARRPPGQ